MVQTYQPLTNAPYYQYGQDRGDLTINIAMNHAAHSPTLVVQDVGRTVSTSISSGAKVNGRAWLLGNAATPGDDWNGHAGQVAEWYSGWEFRPAQQGEILWDLATKQAYWVDSFSGSVPVLRPLNAPRTSGTEIDTGRTDGAGTPKIIYSKRIAFGTLPSSTTKSVAHGITSFPVAAGSLVVIRATISNGTDVRPLSHYYNDGTDTVKLKVDATNVVITTTTNMTAWTAVVELEYAK